MSDPRERCTTSWSDIASRLADERSYWLGTTRPNGSPHVAPVWGAVVDDQLYLYTERRTAKARNLAADGRCVIHLPSAEDVVIVHGSLRDVGTPGAWPEILAALDRKYTLSEDVPYLPSSDPAFDVLYLLEPTSALLWSIPDFEGTQRRWMAA
jgi:nitroimidazol reductase NimA-like FMN-containing flavoprotein (pyridoxamine 5'-phosphate oxidase superfamily)